MTTTVLGRAAECARIEEAAMIAASGARRTVLVVGEPGIGKTALLDTAVGVLQHCGLTLAYAKAEAIERDRPFGLIRRTLDSLVGAARPTFEVVDQLLGTTGTEFRGLVDAPELRFRVIDQITEAVDRLAAQHPLGLLLDDLQWADHGSLDALLALHERLHDRGLLIVAATRPVPADEALQGFVTRIRRDDRIPLGPLDDGAFVELLTDELGSPPTADQLTWFGRAGGNPLFIRTLVASQPTDVSAEHRFDTGDLPASVRRLVGNQVRTLEPETRALLDIAATFGGALTLRLLADVADVPLGEVIRRITPVLSVDLLVDGNEGLRFRHDLVREVIYDEIKPSVRAALHLAIGRHLLGQSSSAADAAHHFLRGAQQGDVESAAVLRQAAGEIGRVAPIEASQLLERALEVVSPHHSSHNAIVVELAQSYVFSDRLDASVDLVEARLGNGLDAGIEIDLRIARAQVFFLRGEARRASAEFEAIAALLVDDVREPVVLADAAVCAMFAVDLATARERAERSLSTADVHADTSAPPLALGVLSWLTALGGDLEAGVRLATEAITRANRAEGLEGHRRIPHLFCSQCLLWADRPDDATASLRSGLRISGELGMGWDEPMYHALAADKRIRFGEWDDALAEIEAGIRRSTEVGAAFADSWLHLHHGRVRFAQGRFDEADVALDRAMEGTAGRGGQGVDQVWWLRALLLALDDPPAAADLTSSLWEKLDELGVVLRAFEVAPDLVMIALAADDRRLAHSTCERVRELADRHPSTVAELARAWCDGLVSGRTDLLERAADVADHSRSPVAAARARADAARTRGDDRAAGEELVGLGAAGWARWHLGVPSSPRSAPSPGSGWESLTPSERRVVELVGLGHTNADIADVLSISRRTVESHLYRSYPKLGMSSRVELALFVDRRRGD